MRKRLKYWWLTRVIYRVEYRELIKALDNGELFDVWGVAHIESEEAQLLVDEFKNIFGENLYIEIKGNRVQDNLKKDPYIRNPWDSHRVVIPKKVQDKYYRRVFRFQLFGRMLEITIYCKREIQ